MDDERDNERPVIRAACVQLRSGIDRAANAAAAVELIGEAAGKGAHFIVTPEMTNAVDKDAARLSAALPEGEGIEEIGAFAAAAAENGVWLLIGSLAIKRTDGRLANCSFSARRRNRRPVRQDSYVRCRSRQWRELARIARLRARR
ncbi:MAG: nitrilase-related carbon-nitrogen hydrolase [Parvularculaceae bacterium]